MTDDRAMLDAAVAYLRQNLVKTVELEPGVPTRALSETAVRFNDSSWFWTDDNAKAAELLCEPSLYDAEPGAADAALDFVLRMSPGAMIGRRAGPAELRVVSADPAAFRIETAFLLVEGDLTAGIVRHGLRFNDNRSVTAARHAPAQLRARHGLLPVRLWPAAAIVSHRIEATATTATLSYTSRIGRLGEISHIFTVAAERPFVTVEVVLTPAPGIVLEDVSLGTAFLGLDGVPDIRYDTLAVGDLAHAMQGRFLAVDGPAPFAAIVQTRASPGFAYAVHTWMPDGGKLVRVSARSHRRGLLHRVRHRYRLGRVAAPAGITEHRMVTGGGYYDRLDAYAAAMREPDPTADPSMSYDIGAELNAVAVHLLFARRGRYRAAPDPARLDHLTAWYDRHVERYFAFVRPGAADALDRVFTRGIAFVVLSLDCMLRATGAARYRELLATGVRLVLATQRRDPDEPAAHFGDPWSGHLPFLDNHAACILALARAAWHGPDPAIADTVHAAIRGIRLHTGTIDVGGGHMVAYDGLAVLGRAGTRAHVDTGFWNYKLGITLRALHAVLAAAEAGKLAATDEQRQQAELRIALARQQLRPSFRWHGDTLEVLTSRLAGETNSETQPWVVLGLVPIVDRQIEALDP